MKKTFFSVVLVLGTLFTSSMDAKENDCTKFALVTGASRGVGHALAEQLLREHPDCHVLITARTKEPLYELAERYQGRVTPIVADISNPSDVAKIRETVIDTVGDAGLSWLVLNSGAVGLVSEITSLVKRPVREIHQELASSFSANAAGPIVLALSLLDSLKQAKGNARILGITTRLADAIRNPAPVVMSYAMAKAAFENALEHLQAELAQTNVAVSWLVPGEVDTKLQGDLRATPKEQFNFVEILQQAHAQGELIPADRSAHFVAYVLLDTARREFERKDGWDIYYRRQGYPEVDKIPKPPSFLQQDWSSS